MCFDQIHTTFHANFQKELQRNILLQEFCASLFKFQKNIKKKKFPKKKLSNKIRNYSKIS